MHFPLRQLLLIAIYRIPVTVVDAKVATALAAGARHRFKRYDRRRIGCVVGQQTHGFAQSRNESGSR